MVLPATAQGCAAPKILRYTAAMIANLATVAAAVSAAASATAAFGALGQVRKSAQGSEANAYLQLMDRYSAPEMRESIVALAKLWRVAQARNETVLRTYLHLLDADKIVADTLFSHCRRVSSYFIDTTRLYTAGLISKKVFVLAVAHPGLNTFYEVAVPLNEHKAGGHNSVWAQKELKKIMPAHGEGMY
ncbi:hypothetical protein [Polymorphobacter megasporae]|uniref:hypothetical protein n=1 Tax=Glacieibacterium megasporae TaxID=2835787 RepID=UPI001C1E4060|nr:hypothetical protein [Polymorphobacter megasporae]UAJ10026.1 hypothetical protein KTC28_17390 [Polymorphobacter megasporae]